MKYHFLNVNSTKKMCNDMSVPLGDKCPSCYSTMKNWVARIKTGHLSTEDEECSGRPIQVTVPESVEAIHSIILDNQRISTKRKEETQVIFWEMVGCIIQEILDMGKLSAK
jgi:hypothetical protein